MQISKGILMFIIGLLFMSVSKCDKEVSKKTLSKIQFDYSGLDANGMISSDNAVDYEFCIPKEEDKLAEVKSIEPDVKIPAMAKGRIGCSNEEYLCIVSTKGPDWKEKLYAIASLPYVKRIIQTYYE